MRYGNGAPNVSAYCERLVTEIKQAGLTGADIARETGIAPSTISAFASGRARDPRHRTVEALQKLAAEVKRQGY